MASFISEGNIEQALLQRLQHIHGFNVLDCYTAKPEDLNDGSRRADKRDVARQIPVDIDPESDLSLLRKSGVEDISLGTGSTRMNPTNVPSRKRVVSLLSMRKVSNKDDCTDTAESWLGENDIGFMCPYLISVKLPAGS
ncbi:hypothetical protein ABIE59_001116 [Marinobacter sp. MBR-99]|jgi:type I restriction enzyme R subunit|uniref:hypothetical protein n=1 Tax=Marinobacter sp. MBR-99 TaxID=3156461 RepID=UPI0033943A76